MEKLMVEAYDMECMKMALLKHEETFKQQVYELHRVYEIQRMLMKKMQRSMQNINEESSSWSTLTKNGNIYHQNHHHLQKQHHHDHGDHANDDDDDDEMEDESEIDLTLGLGPTTRYSQRRKRKKKTTTVYSESLGMLSSSSSSNIKTRLATYPGVLECV